MTAEDAPQAPYESFNSVYPLQLLLRHSRRKVHILAEPDKFFGQEGNDPFCAAIESRGTLSINGAICATFMMTLTLSRRIQTRAM
jgi:hypothetical protein